MWIKLAKDKSFNYMWYNLEIGEERDNLVHGLFHFLKAHSLRDAR